MHIRVDLDDVTPCSIFVCDSLAVTQTELCLVPLSSPARWRRKPHVGIVCVLAAKWEELELRGARSARADAMLCTSSGINLIVPLSFQAWEE